MRILDDGKKVVAVTTVMLAVCGVLCVCQFSGADEQPPEWPLPPLVTKDSLCVATGQTCLTCPGQATGCTSGIPSTWSQGTCKKDDLGLSTCSASTFSCGALYNCNTGDPTGSSCWGGVMCK